MMMNLISRTFCSHSHCHFYFVLFSARSNSSSDGGWKLVDFNARIERHACLGAVLRGEDLKNEACYVFQRFARGEAFDEVEVKEKNDMGLVVMTS
jgi:hypothetical protein